MTPDERTILETACEAAGCPWVVAYERPFRRLSRTDRAFHARVLASVALRARGYTLPAIAALMGLRSHSSVHEHLIAAREWIERGDRRESMLQRHDTLLAARFPRKESPSLPAASLPGRRVADSAVCSTTPLA